MTGSSLADIFRQLSEREQRKLLATLSPSDLEEPQYDWRLWRRPHQVPPPPPWSVWALVAGRGSGKSWVGARWVRSEIESGRRRCIAIVGPTHLAARKIMVEGGLLAACPPSRQPVYEMATGRITFSGGGVCHLVTAESPERIRGYNFDGAWCDERRRSPFLESRALREAPASPKVRPRMLSLDRLRQRLDDVGAGA